MLCLLLIGRKKKERKKREMARTFFFPRAVHALLAVLCGIFAAAK
jgi:hypothetical protein